MPANVRDDHLPGPGAREQGVEPDADQRGDLAARHRRRRGNGAIFGREFRQCRRRSQARNHALRHLIRVNRPGALVRRQCADRVALAVENRRDADQRPGIHGIELHGLAVMLERLRGLAGRLLHRRDVAIQKCRIRGCRDRLSINAKRLVPSARRGCRLGLGQQILDRTETQHVDAAAQLRQRRILGQRGFEAGQRIGVAIELEHHLPAPDQRRQVRRIALQRAVESRRGVLLAAARHQQIGHGGFGGIEGWLLLQGGVEFAFRVAVIAELQIRPAAINDRGQRRRRTLGSGRKDVVGMLRRADRDRRCRLLCAA